MSPLGRTKFVKGERVIPNRVERSKDQVVWERFLSVWDAGNRTGSNPGNIISVCEGKWKKEGGYFWRYSDDAIYMSKGRTMKEKIKLDLFNICFVCGSKAPTSCTFKSNNADIGVCKDCCESLARSRVNPASLI